MFKGCCAAHRQVLTGSRKMSSPITPHRMADLVTLEDFIKSGESPWKIDRLRKVARLALTGDAKYKRLRFSKRLRVAESL